MGPLNKDMPPTPSKPQFGAELQPPTKRFRHLNYEDQSQLEDVTLTKKLNEIKFPNRVPNSPYSTKQTVPATPISMMMELKNWQRNNVA
mmetsp:Transcript_7265/g.5548  ORF Transcript_7265/g.5548 Transcript_7265/m.5548 type:complete len:89 (+) Transcript_7265:1042-1308(+)